MAMADIGEDDLDEAMRDEAEDVFYNDGRKRVGRRRGAAGGGGGGGGVGAEDRCVDRPLVWLWFFRSSVWGFSGQREGYFRFGPKAQLLDRKSVV